MRVTVLSIAVLCFTTLSLHAEVFFPNGSKQLTYQTSWVGNSFGGLNPDNDNPNQRAKGRWVQQDISDIWVTPDGTVYTNIPWEEAGGNCSMYKDGIMLGNSHYTHGWGRNGGNAVAVNDKYVYIALIGNNEGGGLNNPDVWPPKGFDWYGVCRRQRSDFTKAASFDHGKGGQGDTLPKSFMVVNEVANVDAEGKRLSTGHGAIAGLWADNERLLVANPLTNKIEIYDAETMLKQTEWILPEEAKGKIKTIDMSPDGNLWILIQQPREFLLAERFIVLDKEGKIYSRQSQNTSGKTVYCPIVIQENREENFPNNYQPSTFCFDNEGRLLVADAGTWQMIFIFEKRGQIFVPPQQNIGVPMASLRQGVHGDFTFRNISGIGCDAEGNLYVVSDWATTGGGTIIESYGRATSPRESVQPPLIRNVRLSRQVSTAIRSWKLNWRIYGLCFIDCATLDPDDETIVYTKEERFKMDWSKNPGEEWSFLGSTSFRPNPHFKSDTPPNDWKDQFRDPRLHIDDSGGVWARNINGKKFLFVNDMSAVRLQVYALNFEHERYPVRASVLFSPQHYRHRNGEEPTDWMPGQPEKGEWIWTNSLSEGEQLLMDAKEFQSREEEARGIEGWWVDSNGDVWQTTFNKGLRRFRCQGLDKNGNPIWNFENLDIFPHPAEFKDVKRIRYYPETDTLYLGGTVVIDGVEHKHQHWKPMGPMLCRYDNFLKGSQPGSLEGKLKWKTMLPYVGGSSGHESCEPMCFDVAGDYIFVPYTGASRVSGFKTGHIEVIRADNASPVGWMEPDQKTVGEIGLQDMRECLSAHKLKNGEYIIFLEDDYKAKVVMFRWKP